MRSHSRRLAALAVVTHGARLTPIAALVLSVLVSSQARAVVLPDASSDGTRIELDLGTYVPPPGLAVDMTETFDEVTGHAVVEPGLSSTPSVSASIVSTNVQSGTDTAYAGISYFYAVTGATGPVPVDVHYLLATTATASGTSIAQVNVFPQYNIAGGFQDIIYQRSDNGVHGTSQIENTYVNASAPDQVYEVSISVNAQETYVNSTATAYADPYIYIDPAYLAAHPGVGLQISEGVGNIAAVPEPASWALMLAGVGVFAGARRIRQRSAAGRA